jgi:hypothetical protein
MIMCPDGTRNTICPAGEAQQQITRPTIWKNIIAVYLEGLTICIITLSGAYSTQNDKNGKFRGFIIEILARNKFNLQKEQRKP